MQNVCFFALGSLAPLVFRRSGQGPEISGIFEDFWGYNRAREQGTGRDRLRLPKSPRVGPYRTEIGAAPNSIVVGKSESTSMQRNSRAKKLLILLAVLIGSGPSATVAEPFIMSSECLMGGAIVLPVKGGVAACTGCPGVGGPNYLSGIAATRLTARTNQVVYSALMRT